MNTQYIESLTYFSSVQSKCKFIPCMSFEKFNWFLSNGSAHQNVKEVIVKLTQQKHCQHFDNVTGIEIYNNETEKNIRNSPYITSSASIYISVNCISFHCLR